MPDPAFCSCLVSVPCSHRRGWRVVQLKQHTKALRKIVKMVLEYDSADSPFAKGERKALLDLFERSAVMQHSVFKVRRVPRAPCFHYFDAV
jgi:hypothetical protein